MGQTTVSIRVDEYLWRKVKHYCIDHNLTLSELVEELVRQRVEVKKKELK